MTRRPKRGEGREGDEPRGVAHVYEGPEVLTALLGRAGSALSAEEVTERFRSAQSHGEERSDAIPGLFEQEPRFASPDEARRLYGNLFGLWDRLAAGLPAGDDAPAVAEEPEREATPLPRRGAVAGEELTPEVVEAVWKHLAAMPEREKRRLRDRFENAQPDLAAWLEALPLPPEAGVAAQDLGFEAWAMFDVAFGDRVGAVAFKDLRAIEAEPPPAEAVQPALAAYAAEALDLVQEDDPAFAAADRAQVERVVAAVAAALTGAIAGEVN